MQFGGKMKGFCVGFEVEFLSKFDIDETEAQLSRYLRQRFQTRKKMFSVVVDYSVSAGIYRTMHGMELVTPPRETKESLRVVHAIFDWIRETGGRTNKSTGLHINISFADDKKNDLINPIQLLANLDDYAIAKHFKRANNTYCVPWRHYISKLMRCVKAEIKHIKTYAQDEQSLLMVNIDELIKLAIENELVCAGPTILSPARDVFRTFDTKYTSVNIHKLKQGYIEFRMTGGPDYHNCQHLDKIIDHFQQAMTKSLRYNKQTVDTWLNWIATSKQ